MKFKDKYNKNSIYTEIASKYYKEIFNYCHFKLGYHHQNAEECTQEVFVVLMIKWGKLSSHENIRAWLYRTADNIIKNHNRKNCKQVKELSSYEKIEEAADLGYLEDYGAFELLSGLTLEEQNLLKEYYLDKATASELAVRYHISESAIHVRIYRIKKKMKNILKSEDML